jgi:hypothetical protein
VAKWHRFPEISAAISSPLAHSSKRVHDTPIEVAVGGKVMHSKKIAVVAVLCAVVALVACRREETYTPMKLGNPAAQQPSR